MLERIVATVTEQVTQRLAPLLQQVPVVRPVPVIQPAPVIQPVPVIQPAPVVQPVPVEQSAIPAQVAQPPVMTAMQPTSLPSMPLQQPGSPLPGLIGQPETTSLVQSGIQGAHTVIADESLPSTGSTPGLLFRSSSLPLDARVSDKLK